MGKLHSVQLTSTGHPLAEEWWQLYESAFPTSERRGIGQHAAALQNPAYHCLHLADESGFVGILAYWQWDTLVYIEHLAIAPQRRGQGFGHNVLELFDTNVIVEIEPAVDEETVRRLAFYESCGFLCLPQPHVQLPYQAGEPQIPLWLLCRPALDNDVVLQFEKHYLEGPMRYREHA